METSKPRFEIDLAPKFRASVRALPKEERQKIGWLLEKIRHAFGFPHQHKGIGLRKLNSTTYECRYGLKIRLIFEKHNNILYFQLMGNHDEIVRFLSRI